MKDYVENGKFAVIHENHIQTHGTKKTSILNTFSVVLIHFFFQKNLNFKVVENYFFLKTSRIFYDPRQFYKQLLENGKYAFGYTLLKTLS